MFRNEITPIMRLTILFILINVVLISSLSGQLESTFDGGYILDDKKYYDKDEIRNLLESKPKSLEAYNDYSKMDKSAKKAGTFSLLSIGAGALLLHTGTQNGDPNPALITAGIAASGAAIFFLVRAISKNRKAKTHKQTIIPLYNDDTSMGFYHMPNRDKPIVTSSNSGLGIQFNF